MNRRVAKKVLKACSERQTTHRQGTIHAAMRRAGRPRVTLAQIADFVRATLPVYRRDYDFYGFKIHEPRNLILTSSC